MYRDSKSKEQAFEDMNDQHIDIVTNGLPKEEPRRVKEIDDTDLYSTGQQHKTNSSGGGVYFPDYRTREVLSSGVFDNQRF